MKLKLNKPKWETRWFIRYDWKSKYETIGTSIANEIDHDFLFHAAYPKLATALDKIIKAGSQT